MKSHVAWRVFLSLWLIYSIHWATDFVREHFLVASIVERGTFALDEYRGMHNDIFQHSNGHAYHGANPGISMLAAVPYAVARPLVDKLVARELATRNAEPDRPAEYQDPREARRIFYQQAREKGLDVRFGLIGLITMVACMAPLAALGGTIFFRLLQGLGLSLGPAVAGVVLYAFGTPMFLRTGYLNQNLAVGVVGLIAFALLWNPGPWTRLEWRRRWIIAGFLAGFALLCDYSGALMVVFLGAYAGWRRWQDVDAAESVKGLAWFAAGVIPPLLVLWWYQWAAFGFPFLPPQHYMPPVEWSDLGYQGVARPQAGLFVMLLIDPRFGLFVTAPLTVLALAAPWVCRRGRGWLPAAEIWFMLALGLGYVLFFSTIHYTRLQVITGIRYLIPVVPFLTLAALAVLVRLPRVIAFSIALVSLVINWGLAMGRFQEQERSILDTLVRVYGEGFALPALSTLSKMSPQYLGQNATLSPLPVFIVTGIIVWAIWRVRIPGRPWWPGQSAE